MPPSSPSGIEPTTLRLKDFVIDDDVARPWDTDNLIKKVSDYIFFSFVDGAAQQPQINKKS